MIIKQRTAIIGSLKHLLDLPLNNRQEKHHEKNSIRIIHLGTAGTAQAALLDGTLGVNKHNVVGFGQGDFFVAQSQVSGTSVTLTDVGTSVVSSTPGDISGLASGFIHDFVFTAVQDTFASVSAAIQLSDGSPGFLISPLVVEVWQIVSAAVQTKLAFASLDSGANPGAIENVALVANETYVVRMSNEGGTIGLNADYTLNVFTPVPVPAAVWLFGTAMIGLFGLRRKSRMAVAA